MKSLIGVAAMAGAVLALPALAQTPLTNSKAPVDVVADNLETSNTKCEAVYSGNAEALQGTARLRANTLTIFTKRTPPKPGANSTGCGDMERLEADGSVYYVTPEQRARSNHATYEAGSTTITMTGDVVAVRGQNVLRGDRMVFNTDTGEGHVEGTAKGPGAKGRPRGVFYPQQSSSDSEKPK